MGIDNTATILHEPFLVSHDNWILLSISPIQTCVSSLTGFAVIPKTDVGRHFELCGQYNRINKLIIFAEYHS